MEELWQGSSSHVAAIKELNTNHIAVRGEVDRLSVGVTSNTQALQALQEGARTYDTRLREIAQKAESSAQAAARRSMELSTDVATLKRSLDEHTALARRLTEATRDIDSLIESIRSGGSGGAGMHALGASNGGSHTPKSPPSGSSGAPLSPSGEGVRDFRLMSGAAPSAEAVTREGDSRLRTLIAPYVHYLND